MSGVPAFVRWLTRVGIIPRAAIAQLDPHRVPEAQSVLNAGALAELTYRVLDELDEDLVLIARAGQNLERFGLTYSHLGFAVRNHQASGWSIVHLLTAEDFADSRLYEEGVANFFSDRPHRFEAGILTLPADVRDATLRILRRHGARLHNSRYSLTSYPWQTATQNSNQWILEILACAIAGPNHIPEPSREAAQTWLKAAGYRPSQLAIPLYTQWAGPLLRSTISFEDQPAESRRQGIVSTVTVDSVITFLCDANSPLGNRRHSCRLLKLDLESALLA